MLSEKTQRKLKGLGTCSTNGKHRCRDLFKIATECPDLWYLAYTNICANAGATTPGVDGVSQDGYSAERVENLIRALKDNQYFPIPSRRVYIPKSNGKKRPLGIPSGADKLVQEVWRILLEAVYEPTFSVDSHGFRSLRSCHTALTDIQRTWTGTKWFIEFDIKGFFDNIDHQKMVEMLEKRIDDTRFISVVKRMLKAGYMENWVYHKTYSGTPQGGVISPCLANIYLNELDEFIADLQTKYTRGKCRASNPAYKCIQARKNRLEKKINEAKATDDFDAVGALLKEWHAVQELQLSTPSKNQHDPNYKRLRYCRYADDFLLGFIGTKAEATAIADDIRSFLHQSLKLDVAEEKSGIKHAAKESVIFLGYEIDHRSQPRTLWYNHNGKRVKKRTMMQHVNLRVPKSKVRQFAARNRYGNLSLHKARHRPELLYMSSVELVLQYNAELRGFAQYYALADDVKIALHAVVDLGVVSLLKTLAAKHQRSVRQVSRYLNHGGYRGIVSNGKLYKIWTLAELKVPSVASMDCVPNTAKYGGRTELTQRIAAERCEYCGATDKKYEVHHVRKLADIKDGKERWQKLMIARRRKTLVLCVECHDLLHAGKLPDLRNVTRNHAESRVR